MDAQMLRLIMKDKGITVNEMCLELGISRKAFWSKCKGLTEFKQSEIVKIVEILGTENGNAIFFPLECPKRHVG